MNHVYRSIWNAAVGTFIAVAENTNARGKASTRSIGAAVAAAVLSMGSMTAIAAGLPTGGQIVSGQGSISQNGSQMTITQQSGKMVTNWNGFDIGAGNTVQFNQPNASAISLNRVIGGGGASQILGAMKANGQVWLINPGGVVIGKGATINVAGLVASSANISDTDFLAGKYTFTGGANGGAVINQGNITAANGVVALIGSNVVNSGSINTPNGTTALVSGDQVTLDFNGDGLLNVAIDKGALNALVSNEGQISADGGSVLLSARAADAALSSVVNNAGMIVAHSLSSKNGRIVLDNDGTTKVSGVLDVSNSAGNGGNIIVEGNDISVQGAAITANGTTGGGTVAIGGGMHGADTSIRNAQTVVVDASTAISADATTNGNAGQISVWSDGTNFFAGSIFIRGGAQGGNGGLAEVSGMMGLSYTGVTHGLSTLGAAGTLLLDPDTIQIWGGEAPGNASTDPSTWSPSGTSLGTEPGNTTAGTLNIYESTLEAQEANVSLYANKLIHFNDLSKDANGNALTEVTHAATGTAAAYTTGDGMIKLQDGVSFTANTGSKSSFIEFDNKNNTLEVSGAGYIYMQAGYGGTGQIGNGGADPNTNQGVFNLVALGGLDAGGKATSASAYGSTNWTGVNSATPSAGTITLLGADGLDISGDLTTYCGYVYLHADSDHAGGGNLVVSSKVKTNGGDFDYAWGYNAGQTATFTFGSVVNVVCPDGTCNQSAGQFTAVPGAGGAGGGKSANTTILGGQLVVGGDVDTSGWQIHGGSSIETDGDSLINVGSGTTFDPSVLDDTGKATSTVGAVGLQAGEVTIEHSGVTGLNDTTLQLKPADKGSNVFVSNDQGIWLGDGTVNRDGTVTGQNHTSTFLSASDLAYLQSQNGPGLLIGATDSTGTIEVGHRDGSTADFAFNGTGQVGIIGGTAVVNGQISNSEGSVVVEAADPTDHNVDNTADQTATSTGKGNVIITANGQVSAGSDALLVAGDTGNADGGERGGNFVNDNNSLDAIQVGTSGVHGRWLVYSSSPEHDVRGALEEAFKIYEATYKESDGTYAVDSNGNLVGTDVASLDDRGQKDLNGNVNDPVGSRADLVQILNKDEKGNNGFLYSTPAFLEAQLVGTVDKTYDGSTSVTSGTTVVKDANGNETGNTLGTGNIKLVLDNGTGTAIGALDGDDVSQILTGANWSGATFDDKNAGSGKTVTLTGITLGTAVNTGQGNGDVHVYGYRLKDDTTGADTVSAAIGTVDKAKVIASITGQDKTYDGTTGAVVNGVTLSGVVAGETVTAGSSDAAFNSKNVDEANAITANIALDGSAASQNYELVSDTATVGAHITAKTITAGADNVTKTYDGTTDANLSGVHLNGVESVDAGIVNVSGTGDFNSKNVLDANSVNGSGLSLTGNDHGNYALDTSAQVASGNIIAKTVTASADDVTKTYDGNTSAQLNNVTLNGRIGDDEIGVTGSTGSFADKNAGNGKVVDGSGLALTGADASNYAFDQTGQVTTGDITPKTITASATAADKVYDATTGATVTGVSLSGRIGIDDVWDSANSANFSDKNAGTGKTVTVGLNGLTGADAGNYVLASDTVTTTADISKAQLIASANANDKAYDGNTSATLNGNIGLSGLLGNDVVSAEAGSANFNSKNVDEANTVTVNGITLSDVDAQNYDVNTTTSTSAHITAKTITASADNVSKTYDGNTSATLSNIALSGVVSGEEITVAGNTGNFNSKNVDEANAVDGSGLSLVGNDHGNYALDTTKVADGNITAKAVTASADGVTKTYDGTTAAQLSNVSLQGTIEGDQIFANGSQGSFNDKNVGNGKTINGSGLSLAGTDAGNYVFDTSDTVATASITPKAITASGTASDKVYDGNTIAQLSGVTLSGIVQGDDIGITGSAGSFDNKNVGNSKTVIGSGLALTGDDSGNYSFDTNSQVATADVTPKTVTLSGTGADKTYDGKTDADLSGVIASGVVAGDDVNVTGSTGSFADPNVGTDKAIDGSGLSLAGDDAGNYVFVKSATVAHADVNSSYNTSQIVAAASGVNGIAQSASETAQASRTPVPPVTAQVDAPLIVDNTFQDDAAAIADEFKTSMVSMEGRASLGINDAREERAQKNTLVVFRERNAQTLDNRGTFHVIDRGNTIELEGVAQVQDQSPDLKGNGGEWQAGKVVLANGEVTEYHVRMLNDGTLLVTLPKAADTDNDEVAASYGIAVAKKRLGVGVKAIKAVVIQASNGDAVKRG